jgi:hypothetical protein
MTIQPGNVYALPDRRVTVVELDRAQVKTGGKLWPVVVWDCSSPTCQACEAGEGHRSLRQSFLYRVRGAPLVAEQLVLFGGAA